MFPHYCRLTLFVFVGILLIASVANAENWPAWRGPYGDSRSSEQGLPLIWGEDTAIAWKTPLPGPGNSTPAIWDNAVFVTCQSEDKLLLLRLDKRSGKIVWTRQVGFGATRREADRGDQKFHRLQNLASPSPTTDGEVVIAHFGNGDLAAYDFDGKLLWKRNLQDDHGKYTIWWGHANSPVLHGDLVISVCMQDSMAGLQEKPATSYLVANEKKTGRLKWKTPRMTGANAEEGDSYTTPVFHKTGDQVEMIVMGGNQLDAYDPSTGKQLWKLPGLIGGRTITGPTAVGGYVFATRGMKGAMVALKLKAGRKGELSRKDLAWRYNQGTADSCSPVVWSDLLFMISDDGIARCFDGRLGKLHWKKRLKGKYKTTPLAAEGRIYFLNQEGLCTVVSASSRYDRLAENQLDDTTLASPAVSGGHLFIRGHKALYSVRR